MLKHLDLPCEKIHGLISAEEIKFINNIITDPENLEDSSVWEEGERLGSVEVGGPEFEVGREEDYHELGSPGILETLIETILPYECREDNSVLWLTTVIVAEIAQNQAFYEGNKRTAYMAGTLFIVKCQLLDGKKAVYPMLDRELTDRISELAVDNASEEESSKSRDEFHSYLEQRLCD